MSTDSTTKPAEPFVSREQALRLVQEKLAGLPPEALDACRLELDERLTPPSETRMIEQGLLGDDRYYAIHNSELNLLSEAASLAKDAWQDLAGHGLMIIGKLLFFLFRYRRQRVVLDKVQGLVLITLKDGPTSGMMPEAIIDALPLKGSAKPSLDDVRRILKTLRDMPVGEKKADFVVEEDGYWRAKDV